MGATKNRKGKKNKVFIADDSQTVRTIVAKFLEKDHEVYEAANGRDLLSLIDEHIGPDGLDSSIKLFVVLLSLELSDYTGIEVAAKLREKYNQKDLPIILNTSNNRREVILKALDVGINDYIVKPFPRELLISKIHKIEKEIPVHNLKLSQTISKIPFFYGVPESQVAYAINTCAETVEKEKGETVCEQGDNNYDLYILMKGKCEVLFNGKKVSEITPIDMIGEIGFMEEKDRSATVKAMVPSTVIVFEKKSFDDFLNEDRAISEIICKNIIRSLGARVKKTNKIIEDLKILSHQHLTY